MKYKSKNSPDFLFFQPFCSLIQIHGHNRARQRDKLGHILEEFATLQDEVIQRGTQYCTEHKIMNSALCFLSFPHNSSCNGQMCELCSHH